MKNPIDLSKEVFVISTYPNTQAVINTTKECIEAVKNTGRKVILTSHIPLPKELAVIADYCITDNNNILTKHTFYNKYWSKTPEYDLEVYLKGEDNDVYHGPACYSNYYNGVALAKNLGFEKTYLLNYDYILKDDSYINHISKILNTKKAFFGKDQDLEGNQIVTWFAALQPNTLLSLPKVETAKEYDNLMNMWGAESNGYENLMYHFYKNIPNLHWENNNEFEIQTKNTFNHKDYSNIEYFTILPTNKENTFVSFFKSSNNNDSRLIKYEVYKNDELIKNNEYKVTSKYNTHDFISYNDKDEFKIVYKIYDLDTDKYLFTKSFFVNQEYRQNQIHKNGKFTFKNMPG